MSRWRAQQTMVVSRLAGFACLLVIVSCNAKQDALMAESALGQLHNHLAAHEDDQIFAEATPEFQKAMNAENSRDFFKRIRGRLGAPHASKPISIQVNHMPAGTFMVCQFQTSFDKGNAQENVTWHLQDGKPRLVVYQVISPKLTE
jgi:Protein of unknown function (DUF4019)